MKTIICIILFFCKGYSPVSYSIYTYSDGEYEYSIVFDENVIQLIKSISSDDFQIAEILSQSKYVLKDDMVIAGNFKLKIVDDKRIEIISYQELKKGTVFCCTMRFYPNGKRKFMGEWKDGKQDGVWFYVDPHDTINQVTYDMGKPVKQVINPPLSPLLKYFLSLPMKKWIIY
jgi:antitoxin component YwqK of YwqJK toxin-antitoxin module